MRRNAAYASTVDPKVSTRDKDDEESQRKVHKDNGPRTSKSSVGKKSLSLRSQLRQKHVKLLITLLASAMVYCKLSSISHRALWNKHKVRQVPIFLSVQIPNSPQGRDLTWTNLVSTLEQLSREKDRKELRVYYDTTSKESHVPVRFQAAKINKQCKNLKLKCHHLEHRGGVTGIANDQMEESLTLGHMQHFCSVHPFQTVVFLQSTDRINPIWQRHLQGAAMACQPHVLLSTSLEETTKLMSVDQRCDVCGLQLDVDSSFWQYSGNTFSASCEHINRLVPVNDENNEEDEDMNKFWYRASQKALLQRVRRQLTTSVYAKDHSAQWGLDQYTASQWIASHPLTKPCAMSERQQFPDEYWQVQARSFQDFRMIHRPTLPMTPFGGENYNDDDARTKSLRMREMFHHATGWLIRWNSLYPEVDLKNNGDVENSEVAATLAWWWRILPDGAFWKHAVQLYGLQAAEIVTLPYAQNDAAVIDTSLNSTNNFATFTNVEVPRRSAFAPLEKSSSTTTTASQIKDKFSIKPKKGAASKEKTVDSTGSSHSIFYNIWVASKVEEEHAENRVREQLAILQNSGASPMPTVYYNLIGDYNTTLDVQALCDKHQVHCQLLEKYTAGVRYEGHVLESMQEYCSLHPSSTVSYLTSTVGDVQRGNFTYEHTKVLWRHATKAAVSPLCQVSSTSAEQCNVCGLAFYTLPHMFFPGEMFKADCHYVNNLIPPREFEAKQTDAATAAMVETIRDRLTMTLFSQQKDFLGIDEFAIQHWITSHPAFKPCDLAKQDASYWTKERALTQFQYSKAPRHAGVPDLGYPFRPFWDQELRKIRPYARREYSYLAGHFFRWNRLYGRLPKADSWVYDWFPEGDAFREAATLNDAATALEVIVAPFVNTTVPEKNPTPVSAA